MRTTYALLAALCLAAPAAADIIAVRFKTPKIANRFKDHLVQRGGELVVIGEKYDAGPGVAMGTGGVPADTRPSIELVVANPDDPNDVAYKVEIDKEGVEKVVFVKKKRITIGPDDFESTILLIKDGTLATLSADYTDRRRQIDELLAARDLLTKGGAEWMAEHQRVLLNMGRLETWLRSTAFPGAADKLAKELAKQRKLGIDDATAERKKTAMASVKVAEVPETLVAASAEIGGEFRVQESQHARIVYREGISDERVESLLLLAEEIIDGFRVEFVDPYLDADYQDYIPDHVFAEWFLGYDDNVKFDRYWTEFYRRDWGKHKEEHLKAGGTAFQGPRSPEYVHFWKCGEDENLEGIVAHGLGHDLANLHFDRKRMGEVQDWVEEGLALFLSLEWLGGNSVTCRAFTQPITGKYVHQRKEKKAGELTVQLGLRDYYNALALDKGPKIDKLALKELGEFNDEDLAKSWSFFDYLAKKSGREGQLLVRAACHAARTPTTFIADWRAKIEELLGISGQDAFAVIEERWRAYAELGQDTGDTKRK
jgi:hypothetical protein